MPPARQSVARSQQSSMAVGKCLSKYEDTGLASEKQWMQATASYYSQHFYVKDSEHPYTTEPGQPFQ
jgi:hypothetical protein